MKHVFVQQQSRWDIVASGVHLLQLSGFLKGT